MVTDFVFVVQSLSRPDHFFMEIERPNREIFTKGGQFTADFTQAKDQLLAWDGWITRNHAYLRDKLPGLHKPVFHLVMGRSATLTDDLRQKLQAEFSGGARRFSTYDDLARRFKAITDRLLNA
jgi:hypothetical protein